MSQLRKPTTAQFIVLVGGTGGLLWPTAKQYMENARKDASKGVFLICVDAKAELEKSGIPLNDTTILTLYASKNEIDEVFNGVSAHNTCRAKVLQQAIAGMTMTTDEGAAQMPFIMKSVIGINRYDWATKIDTFIARIFQQKEYTDAQITIWGSAAGGTGNGGMTVVADLIYGSLMPKGISIRRDFMVVTAESYLGVAKAAGTQNGAAFGMRAYRRVTKNDKASNPQIYHFLALPSADGEDKFLRQQTLTNTFRFIHSGYMDDLRTSSPNDQANQKRGYLHTQAQVPSIPYASIVFSGATRLAARFSDLTNAQGTVSEVLFSGHISTVMVSGLETRQEVEALSLPSSSPARAVVGVNYNGTVQPVSYFKDLSTTVLARRAIIDQLNAVMNALGKLIAEGEAKLGELRGESATLKIRLNEIAKRCWPTALERMGMMFDQPDSDTEFDNLDQAIGEWNKLATEYVQTLERLAGMGEARNLLQSRLNELSLQYKRAIRILGTLPEAKGGSQVGLTLTDSVPEDSIIERLLYHETDTAMIARIVSSLVVSVDFADYCRLYGTEFDPVKFGVELAQAERTVGNSYGGASVTSQIYIGVPFDADLNSIEQGLRSAGVEAHLYRIHGTDIIMLERGALKAEEFIPPAHRMILAQMYTNHHPTIYTTLLEDWTLEGVPAMPEIISAQSMSLVNNSMLDNLMEQD